MTSKDASMRQQQSTRDDRKQQASACSLKELCPEDKHKVAQLVKQVVELGKENQALKAAAAKADAAEGKLKQVQECNKEAVKENCSLKNKLGQAITVLRMYHHKVQGLDAALRALQNAPPAAAADAAADTQQGAPQQPGGAADERAPAPAAADSSNNNAGAAGSDSQQPPVQAAGTSGAAAAEQPQPSPLPAAAQVADEAAAAPASADPQQPQPQGSPADASQVPAASTAPAAAAAGGGLLPLPSSLLLPGAEASSGLQELAAWQLLSGSMFADQQTASLSRKVLQFDPSIGSHGALVIQEVPSHLPRLPLLDSLAAAPVQPHGGGASAQDAAAASGGSQLTRLLGGAGPHASSAPAMQQAAAVEEVPVLDLDVSQLSVVVQNEKSGSSIRHTMQQQQLHAMGSESSCMASSTCSRDGQMATEQQQPAAWPGHMQQQQQPWGDGRQAAAHHSSWLADGGGGSGVLQPFNGPERPRSAALHKPSRGHGKKLAAAGGMPVPGSYIEQQQQSLPPGAASAGGHYAAAHSQQQLVAYDTRELLQRFDASLVDILGEVERLEQQQRLARHALHDGHRNHHQQQGRHQPGRQRHQQQLQQWHEQENGQAMAAAWPPPPRGGAQAAFSLDARQQALQERVQLLQREAQLEQQLAAASSAVTGARRGGAAAAAWVAQQQQRHEQQSWLHGYGGSVSTSRASLDDDEVSDILNHLD